MNSLMDVPQTLATLHLCRHLIDIWMRSSEPSLLISKEYNIQFDKIYIKVDNISLIKFYLIVHGHSLGLVLTLLLVLKNTGLRLSIGSMNRTLNEVLRLLMRRAIQSRKQRNQTIGWVQTLLINIRSWIFRITHSPLDYSYVVEPY